MSIIKNRKAGTSFMLESALKTDVFRFDSSLVKRLLLTATVSTRFWV